MIEDTRGENNHNWKPKVEWACPICGVVKMFTPNYKKKCEEEGRTCSLPCGRIQGGMKLRGRHLPEEQCKKLSEKKTGVPLTQEHIDHISLGLRSSQKFADAQKAKDLKGDKNPNWKEKVSWECPICHKIKMVTPKTKEHKELNNQSCSRTCGAVKISKSHTGKKLPGVSIYMKNNNPMKDPKVAAKMGKTLSARFANGELDDLKKIISEAVKKMHKEGRWHITPEGSASISKRMTENNPMKDPIVAEKVGKAMMQLWADGIMKKHPRPDMAIKWSGIQNPMKNLETRKINLQRIIKSWIKNGRFSKGELLVWQSLTRMGFDFVHQHIVEGRKRDYILDFFIKDLNICIEYDGHSGHYQEKGIKSDAVRDEYILEHYGTRTIRIHRDEAFIGKENLENIIEKRLLL